jgi:hypothetical protein
MPVQSLNYCQTIVWRKKRISPNDCTGNMLQNACEKFEFLSNNCSAKKAYFYMLFYRQYAVTLLVVASNMSNILLTELEIWSDILQSISLQKCIQIADILLHKYLLPKCKNKVSKSVKISRQLPVHLKDICQALKKTWAGPQQANHRQLVYRVYIEKSYVFQ